MESRNLCRQGSCSDLSFIYIFLSILKNWKLFSFVLSLIIATVSAGEACTSASQCINSLCLDGYCSACKSDSDCPAGDICIVQADLQPCLVINYIIDPIHEKPNRCSVSKKRISFGFNANRFETSKVVCQSYRPVLLNYPDQSRWR